MLQTSIKVQALDDFLVEIPEANASITQGDTANPRNTHQNGLYTWMEPLADKD